VAGLNDGSSFQNAFDWDFTASPDGSRVFEHTENSFPGRFFDWWTMQLKVGVTYTIQSRFPGEFRTRILFYRAFGTSIQFIQQDFSSGDDGTDFSKIIYTPLIDETNFIQIRGRSFNDIGLYILEILPPPFSSVVNARNFSRMNIRKQTENKTFNIFDIFKSAVLNTQNVSRFTARSQAEQKNISVFDTRQIKSNVNNSNFDILKTLSVLFSQSKFDIKKLNEVKNNSILDFRKTQSHKTFTLFNIRKLIRALVHSLFSSRQIQNNEFVFKHNSFELSGHTLFARNIATDVVSKLGFISIDGAQELIDVALADGDYEIEVRTSENFWEEARSRILFTLSVTAGVITVAGIPNIQNLTGNIQNNFKTRLNWSIADEFLTGTFRFGLFRSLTSPVDVSGTPDQIINAFANVGNYQRTIQQTESEFVAIVAFTDIEQGNASEIFLEWDQLPPTSPSDQYAY